MKINIYTLISAAFCVFVGFLSLSRAIRGSGWLLYCWAVGLWLMAAGVLVKMWELQAAAGFVMVASVVVDERVAARHYATHRLDLQEEAAREIRAMPISPEDEPLSFEVIVRSPGDRHDAVVDTLRSLYVLAPKDARDLTKGGVRPIKQFITRSEADYVKARLEEQGAKVEVRQM